MDEGMPVGHTKPWQMRPHLIITIVGHQWVILGGIQVVLGVCGLFSFKSLGMTEQNPMMNMLGTRFLTERLQIIVCMQLGVGLLAVFFASMLLKMRVWAAYGVDLVCLYHAAWFSWFGINKVRGVLEFVNNQPAGKGGIYSGPVGPMLLGVETVFLTAFVLLLLGCLWWICQPAVIKELREKREG